MVMAGGCDLHISRVFDASPRTVRAIREKKGIPLRNGHLPLKSLSVLAAVATAPRPPTIKEVAALTGVNTKTIARLLRVGEYLKWYREVPDMRYPYLLYLTSEGWREILLKLPSEA